MERRDKQLYAASVIGDIESLNELLKEDKSILDNYGTSTEVCFKETPLHIAASQGHIEFAKVLLQNKPDLVNELDSRLRSPLHLASANGREEMVKLLLSVDSDACLIQDEFGRTPFHLAAMVKGKVDVVNELITARPEAIVFSLNRTITITTLHMYAIRNGPKAIEQLVKVDHTFLNSQDGEGNTILHKVVALEQLQTLEYLVSRKDLIVGLKNQDNITAFDIIKRMPKDSNTTEMHKLLKIARDTSPDSHENIAIMKKWVEKKKNSLLVCATVIASMAYQAALNPPGGVFDDDSYRSFEGKNVTVKAGTSIMAITSPNVYVIFLLLNTLSFVGALSLVLLLTGSPPQFGKICMRVMMKKVYMRFLTFVIWMTTTTIAITYFFGVWGTMPYYIDGPKDPTESAGIITAYAEQTWLGFICIILLVTVGRFFVFIGKMLVKCIKRMLRSVNGGENQRHDDANPTRKVSIDLVANIIDF